MIVVSDTSVISNLIQLELAYILEELFGEIIISKSVLKELSVIPSHLEYINNASWISSKSIQNIELYNDLLKQLDFGEAESIVLSIELKAKLLLIDEKRGRKIASNYGIKISGLIGVLIKAKQEVIITELKPFLDKLIFEIGFRINPKLYSEVLKIVNEE